MLRRSGFRAGAAVVIFCIASAVWLLFAGAVQEYRLLTPAETARLRPAGYPQLVSVKPLAPQDADLCEFIPAGARFTLASALAAEDNPRRASESRKSVEVDRPPSRVVRDSYSTYSAVAVDLTTNETYLQDENLFGLMVFDRLTNTPPTAKFSEPKRRVRGSNTRLEFNCALWVDPQNGDVYSVNNDMLDRMVVFARGAEGNAAPLRQLHTPHRTFGIAVDEAAQELFLTVQNPPQVVVYRKQAADEERPIRVLAGEHTKLQDAHGIAIDAKNNLMFVANHGSASSAEGGRFDPPSITVYPLKASGDTPPLRIIQGPKTQFNWPALLYLDQERKELYVANDMADSILVFHSSDSGDVAPVRVIRGPKTGLKNPTGVFLDTKHDELWVSNMGNHSATVYRRTADGDAAPLRTIRSAPLGKTAQMIGNPGAVGYDSKREEILVPN